jgi:uncharacterized protein (DUF488 family)
MRKVNDKNTKLYTVGYEGLTQGEFIDILNAHNITVLIDVRELPLSRKRGFSKNVLNEGLEEVGIAYLHLRPLGAPRAVRHALRDTGDWETYELEFLRHLADQRESLDQVAAEVANARVCLMCFEEDFSVCHRSLVAARMVELGLVSGVKHLNPRTEKAALTVAAR